VILKGIGCLLLLLSFAAIGFSAEAALYGRRKTLQSFQRFFSTVEEMVRFHSRSPISILEQCCTQKGYPLCLKDCLQRMQLETFSQSWSYSLEKNAQQMYLKKDDLQLLCLWGENFGKTDTEGQLQAMREIQTLLSAQISAAGEQAKAQGALQRSGWIFVGMILTILLI